MSVNSPVLAKLMPPRLGHVLSRQRLIDQLDQAAGSASLLWLSAPGGSGKTTLVRTFLEQKGLQGIWYQADSGDGDFSSFLYYMGIAGEQAAPDKATSFPVFKPEYQNNIENFIRLYFRTLFASLPSPGVLVIDNYQEVPDGAQLHAILAQVCAEVPPGITIIVISRNDPPAAFARLRASDAMKLLGWDTIQLDEQESLGICQMRLEDKGISVDEELLQSMIGLSKGWVAGLVLLLEQADDMPDGKFEDDSYSQSVVFDYFAGEIFQRSDEALQQFLLATAWLPRISTALGEQLSDNAGTGKLLEQLVQRNFFTTRLSVDTYEYHPLFRDFLQRRSSDTLSAKELESLKLKTAHLLDEAGNWVDAAGLYQQAGNWAGLIAMAAAHGSELLMTGRHSLLRDWLQALPEPVREQSDWAGFWLAEAIRPDDLAASRAGYRRAWEGFQASADDTGRVLAWCGIVESYIHGWAEFGPLDQWIAVYDEQLSAIELPAEVAARVSIAMFCALMHRQPDNPAISLWEERVRLVVLKNPNITQRMALGFQLLLYYTVWTGNVGKAGILVDALRASIDETRIEPLDLSLWRAIESTYLWKTGHSQEALNAAQEGLKIADEIGIHLWDVWLLANAVYATAIMKDYKAAGQYLKQMSEVLDRSRLTDVAHYHYLQGWLASTRGEHGPAYEHIQAALEAGNECGSPYVISMMLLSLARQLQDQGDYEAAHRQIEAATRIAGGMHSQSIGYLCALNQARCAFAEGDDESGFASLKQVFKLAREVGYVHHGPWWEADMVNLCVRAMEHDIDPGFVREFVKRRRLLPEEPPLLLEYWPVRIYTLGRFSVLVDDEALPLTGKARHKPLQLLKMIIALGGRQVGQDKILELMWPDSDGDAALQALYTTSHRLRKLLGDKIVKLQDGTLTLDSRSVWVDAWAFERMAGKLQDRLQRSREVTSAAIGQGEGRLSALYPGHFLGSESGISWALPLQERLKSKYLAVLAGLVDYWEQQKRHELALASCNRALELDNLAETFYQRLMQVYDHMGHQAEALAVFRRCRKNLSDGLGVSPSAKTVSIYNAIQATGQ